MSERSWTTVDKSTWGEGAWTGEPDKVQWIDEATGLDCLAHRHPSLGHWCGYVGVGPGHPFHGVAYNASDADWNYQIDVKAHGGLTYSAACDDTTDESLGICHVPEPGRPHDVWWFGFDCAHAGDKSPALAAREAAWGFPEAGSYETYRDLDYIRSECASLAAQLVAAA